MSLTQEGVQVMIPLLMKFIALLEIISIYTNYHLIIKIRVSVKDEKQIF